MKKVKFIGCSDEQARFGQSQDPRKILIVGSTYICDEEEIHSWHTVYFLRGIKPGFNSVCFEEIE